jgi:hypothetical protein
VTTPADPAVSASAPSGPTLPLTYGECRDRFRWTCDRLAVARSAHPITARGPDGGELTVDVATIGTPRPRVALLVMSGVHGVEGFVNSEIQRAALERWVTTSPPDVGVVMIHAVNPWGMAWWRRQNESNVDLNRNFGRDDWTPGHNHRYGELHAALCPDGDTAPTADSLLDVTRALIDAHGYAWVKAAVTEGQYDHPDGLYFGGERTEASNRIVADVARGHLAGAEQVLVVDLHTGHGERGTMTLLSHSPAGDDEDRWLRDRFDGLTIESTASADASSPPKTGQIARGLAAMFPDATWRSVTPEMGTVSDTTMILAERAEHWVHRSGDRSDPDHAAIVWHHRCCSTPDDPAWVAASLEHGRRVIDLAVAAVAGS